MWYYALGVYTILSFNWMFFFFFLKTVLCAMGHVPSITFKHKVTVFCIISAPITAHQMVCCGSLAADPWDIGMTMVQWHAYTSSSGFIQYVFINCTIQMLQTSVLWKNITNSNTGQIQCIHHLLKCHALFSLCVTSFSELYIKTLEFFCPKSRQDYCCLITAKTEFKRVTLLLNIFLPRPTLGTPGNVVQPFMSLEDVMPKCHIFFSPGWDSRGFSTTACNLIKNKEDIIQVCPRRLCL